jgi:4-amino-4-deoxy-L-arabinose transferase-like glycosyltransferase
MSIAKVAMGIFIIFTCYTLMQIKYWHGLLLTCLLIVFPIFGYLGYLPIRIWDESRLAHSAFEMLESKNILIPTFEGLPDFWSAKPPMMIWLQALTMKIIGVNELAVRLPAAMAAFITCIFLYWFFAKKYQRPLVGIFSAVILVTCAGFVRQHGARTGDYDALLVMFTTLFCFYYFLHLEENKTSYLYAAILCLTAATLTKGIASLIFLPAIFVYTLQQRKLLRVLTNYHFYIGYGIYLLLAIGYYILREQYNPGYIKNVFENEIGGRFSYGDGHNRKEDIFYYYEFFFAKTFRDWYKIFFVGIVAAIITKDKFLKKVGLYSLLLGGFYFLVVSKSRAKAEWYDMASYPFFAIVTAIGLYLTVVYLKKILPAKYALKFIVPALLVIAVSIQPIQNSIAETVNPFTAWSVENDDITFFMKNIFDRKYDASGHVITYTNYHADVLWYLKVMRKQGRELPFKHAKDLHDGEKVIAFLLPEKDYIENFYNFSVSDTFGTVTVYSINGKK